MENIIGRVKFNKDGLIPAIIQDFATNEVLMMAYMNEQALEKSIDTGLTHFYSRSRQKLWKKGETSGHVQIIKNIKIDCDSDTLLIAVEQKVAACHTGHYSCFFSSLLDKKNETVAEKVFLPEEVYSKKSQILKEINSVVKDRLTNPKEGSYTNYLFEKGLDKILKKVGEESSEVIIAAKNNSESELAYEVADLFYHIIVLLVNRGLTLEDIYDELEKRRLVK